MRKRWLLHLLTLVIALALLAGCGGNTEKTPANSDGSASTAKVTDSSGNTDAPGEATFEAEPSPTEGDGLRALASTTDLALSPYLVKA